MSEAPYFHIAVLVPDLAEAILRFGAVLELDFADPIRARVPQVIEGGATQEVEVSVTYSRQGPPHFELIEATGDGVFSADRGYGVHHVGAWMEDTGAFTDRLSRLGIGVEMTFGTDATRMGAYFKPKDLFGVRFEACPVAIREGWGRTVHGPGAVLLTPRAP